MYFLLVGWIIELTTSHKRHPGWLSPNNEATSVPWFTFVTWTDLNLYNMCLNERYRVIKVETMLDMTPWAASVTPSICWCFPANAKHLHSICTTSAQRLRRWSTVVQMLCKCFVFAELCCYIRRFNFGQYFKVSYNVENNLTTFGLEKIYLSVVKRPANNSDL